MGESISPLSIWGYDNMSTKKVLAPVAKLTELEEKQARDILKESITPYESLKTTFPMYDVKLYEADGIEVYAIIYAEQ